MGYVPDFTIEHLGVNCADGEHALACARRFEMLFGLRRNDAKECADSSFTGTQIEWMKGPGRGEHGHIALGTKDLPAAREYLEGGGLAFDDKSVKLRADGTPLVIYAKEQIGGFAIHLMQL